jgi:hypothetical protein
VVHALLLFFLGGGGGATDHIGPTTPFFYRFIDHTKTPGKTHLDE